MARPTKEHLAYLAALEKAHPGITTKPMPPDGWTIRGEVLGEWMPPGALSSASHGLYQLGPMPPLADTLRAARDPIANARAALRIARRP